MNEKRHMSAAEAAQLVLEEFAGDQRPVTVEMLARLYSTMFAQQEATIAMFGIVMKNNPKMIFEDDIVALRNELSRSTRMLTSDLIDLSKSRTDGNG